MLVGVGDRVLGALYLEGRVHQPSKTPPGSKTYIMYHRIIRNLGRRCGALV